MLSLFGLNLERLAVTGPGVWRSQVRKGVFWDFYSRCGRVARGIHFLLDPIRRRRIKAPSCIRCWGELTVVEPCQAKAAKGREDDKHPLGRDVLLDESW